MVAAAVPLILVHASWAYDSTIPSIILLPQAQPTPITSSHLKPCWIPIIPMKLSWHLCLTTLHLLYWRFPALKLYLTHQFIPGIAYLAIYAFYTDLHETFPLLQRGSSQASETPIIANDEDVISLFMEQHELFLSSTKSRLTKLQVSAVLDNLVALVM
jgi:hypothetical protein